MLQLTPAGARGLGRAEVRRAGDAHSSVRAVVDGESADAAQRAQHAGHHRRARACGHCAGRDHSLHTYGAIAGEPLLTLPAFCTSLRTKRAAAVLAL